MCHKTSKIGFLVLGIGIGLLISFLFVGWFLRVLVAAALIVLGAISFFGPAASASVENASVARTVVVVKHGETLWDIAQAVDPQGDTRDTVVRIMELNSLTSTSVDAGQRLEIPQPQR